MKLAPDRGALQKMMEDGGLRMEEPRFADLRHPPVVNRQYSRLPAGGTAAKMPGRRQINTYHGRKEAQKAHKQGFL